MAARITWNWQQPDWPDFKFDPAGIAEPEAEFLRRSGLFAGAVKHVGEEDKERLTIELISDEAINTSEIEGEILDRQSVQSSIRRNFGLVSDDRKIPPAEQGIAKMMVDLHRNFDVPLSHDLLFKWNEMLLSGRRDLKDVGRYRSAPVQVVSGPAHEPIVHFEGPPPEAVPAEMDRFIAWFNGQQVKPFDPSGTLTRAAIAHHYFVCIHPFEDGNGRISRAIAEKALFQGIGHATLLALSHCINRTRKAYYDILERTNKRNEITPWLAYFARTTLEAQAHSQKVLDFTITKTRFFDRFRDSLNQRQEKALARMFKAGPSGFNGGLSAENYMRITSATRSTATRDLQDLVAKNALVRSGVLKGTRYHLAIAGNK